MSVMRSAKMMSTGFQPVRMAIGDDRHESHPELAMTVSVAAGHLGSQSSLRRKPFLAIIGAIAGDGVDVNPQ
jgi:hypothetical protein